MSDPNPVPEAEEYDADSVDPEDPVHEETDDPLIEKIEGPEIADEGVDIYDGE